MTRVDFQELTKRQIALTILLVVAVMAVQVYFISYIRNTKADVENAAREDHLNDRIFRAKTDAVSRYKTGFNVDSATAPVPIESATRFYSLLINLLQTTGFEDAAASKVVEGKEAVSFKVSGEAPYFALLELFSTFRQSSYAMRLLSIELKGQTDGYVSYTYVIECSIAPDACQQKTDTKN